MQSLLVKGLTLLLFLSLVSCFVKYKSDEAQAFSSSPLESDSLSIFEAKEKYVREYLKDKSVLIEDSSKDPIIYNRPFMSARKDSIYMQSSKSGAIISRRAMPDYDINLVYDKIMDIQCKFQKKVVYLDADKKEVPLFFGSTKVMTKEQMDLEKRSKYAAIKSYDTLTNTWKYEITDTLRSR